MINILIAAVVALIVGCVAGYYIFRYVIKGKYNRMIEAANKEADVIKEKKLLEVKEKFLNKKSELDKEIQAHNQRMQRKAYNKLVYNVKKVLPLAQRVNGMISETYLVLEQLPDR